MFDLTMKRISAAIALAALTLAVVSCSASAKNEVYFGRTAPPTRNILRYVTGDEPASIDPQVMDTQAEARIYLALYEGLVEYDGKTLQPVPAIAERWDVNNDSSEFVFHLRKNARWSNGDPITANDFVYSLRRGLCHESDLALDKVNRCGLSPEVSSRTAGLAYYIKYAEALNEGAVFVRDPETKRFLLEQDLETPATQNVAPAKPLSQTPLKSLADEYKPTAVEPAPDADTPFHQFMHSPARLTLPGVAKNRNKLLSSNSKLQAAVAGKVFEKVRPEDIGVEAVNDYTVRISLTQPAPFFLGLMAHQFFRLVPRKAIEQYGDHWTDVEHIVTCGPFKIKLWKPYNELVVERDPMNWDSANVHLEEIHFYPSSDNPTTMNLYKVGEVDAVLNHTVPNAWLELVRTKKDYMDATEAAIDYLEINTTRPPFNDVRVRRAFNMAIDKKAWAAWRKIVKPLTAFTPEGIFPGYVQPRGDEFNPEKARQLLAEVGYPVTENRDGSFTCPAFPLDKVEFIYNTQESNRAMGEFMQAQWKQNLGITVSLRNMESKTWSDARAKLDYKGFSRSGWSADYIDPFTFLGIFYTQGGSNSTGWWDQKYVDMLDEANRTLDKQKRYELLGRAEKFLIEAQPVIPLDTSSVNWVKKPYVKGMYPNPGTLFPWKYVYIERDPSKWDYGTPSLAQ
jgi:ABC-type oligopeptide transport system substrate-binding subunit